MLTALQNRRMRHLRGISVRNLLATGPTSTAQSKTTTDDDAPYNLVSPARRALQGESGPLLHSHSFTNLSAVQHKNTESLGPQRATTAHEKNQRPTAPRLRRRSTLHWASASPRVRQSKLEDIVVNRLADTFVSIHCLGISEPVYVSEIIGRSMNPSFAFFDLDHCGPEISRSDQCTVKIWARPSKTEDYCLLVELELNLRSLQFIGRSLEHFHHPLPQNCILIHLSDGIYTSFTDLPADPHPTIEHSIDHRVGSSKPGSSFDALMQLANLDECIQDAIRVRSQLEDDINKLIVEAKLFNITDDQPAELDDSNPQVRAILATEQKRLKQLEKKKQDLQHSLQKRKEALNTGQKVKEETKRLATERSEEANKLQSQLNKLQTERDGQFRRICESLLAIFPIEPVRNRTLQFTIRGIHLPNSAYDDTNRDEIAAALGFTSHLVHLLGLYLSTALPYPIESSGSTSYITDPISIGLSQRRYPLYPITVPYKFEYGVFLLNKDIEALMHKNGLKVLDIRHTLPNLKYLLFVLTAGSGEMPGRKAGGVRGLLGGRLTPDLLRRSSEDSVRSLPSVLSKESSALLKVNGSLFGNTEKDADADPFTMKVSARDGSKQNSMSER
jgi:UV radiation resistance-associated gene protein